MYDFLRVCAATPEIRVADTRYNGEQIIALMRQAAEKNVALTVFPELCITGYTCGDLFLQDALLSGSLEALSAIIKESENNHMITVVGLPFLKSCKLYNVAAVISHGTLLGLVPKSYLPNYSEFYEMRHFTEAGEEVEEVDIPGIGEGIPFGTKLLFQAKDFPAFTLGVEICEDLWVTTPPSNEHALAGATVIANLSASDEVTGKGSYRRKLVESQSARLVCGYIYADAGEGESTTDLVFAGHNLICENGSLLAESRRFETGAVYTELDLGRLVSERRRITTFHSRGAFLEGYEVVPFYLDGEGQPDREEKLWRVYDKRPFVPDDVINRDARCEEILSLQAMGLKKRLKHTHCESAVIGVSGGLDSTLALLVTVKAFDALSLSRKGILAVTMPCFGTTDRTYQNAILLAKTLGVSLKEVPLKESVLMHMKDIGHDPEVKDVTYENTQARMRTQVLMNLANQSGGMVIGTGDMSELALGWATYNGDHMSMYGVNCSVPKTLVRYLVLYYAETAGDETLKKVLLDVLDTPVSPELLPPEDGVIAQKTEDIVGPYDLHDFFLYYMMRFGYSPSKIYFLARQAFCMDGEFDEETVKKWLKTFYRRFFAQQFKRSCLPDGPKVGSVAVSPRGDLRMPSDASMTVWQTELDLI